jgi:hypothetical protein
MMTGGGRSIGGSAFGAGDCLLMLLMLSPSLLLLWLSPAVAAVMMMITIGDL